MRGIRLVQKIKYRVTPQGLAFRGGTEEQKENEGVAIHWSKAKGKLLAVSYWPLAFNLF